MADLRKVIREAYLDLDKRMTPLLMRRDQLMEELAQVNREINRLTPSMDEARKVAEVLGLDLAEIEVKNAGAEQPGVTIKEGIRLVLASNTDGLNSADLHENVSLAYFGNKLERTSFSPQLSRMKSDGEVSLSDGIWRLTSKGRAAMTTRRLVQGSISFNENEPHDAGASHGSDTGSVFD
ncbi:MAG TPA: hypothetical protein K8W01_14660 [Methylorubrum populi]|uniref:Uncharacterized protein n=1 Tax=Methylorubrum populi TaxID=223967 RepID=A0A921JGB6_9HYPH|nr:hypothetical protein [Methylorubrum populi]